MPELQTGRMTTDNSDSLVVLLIGARINRFWLLPLSLPIAARMNRMVRELLADPNSGLLGYEQLGFTTAVQYWRSYEDLDRYARDWSKTHRPTWRDFFARVFKNRALGIWHEAFLIRASEYETLYVNMPKRGLGKIQPLLAAEGSLKTAKGRLKNGPDTPAHV